MMRPKVREAYFNLSAMVAEDIARHQQSHGPVDVGRQPAAGRRARRCRVSSTPAAALRASSTRAAARPGPARARTSRPRAAAPAAAPRPAVSAAARPGQPYPRPAPAAGSAGHPRPPRASRSPRAAQPGLPAAAGPALSAPAADSRLRPATSQPPAASAVTRSAPFEDRSRQGPHRLRTVRAFPACDPSNTHQAPCSRRQARTWRASAVWTNEREMRVNSLFPQATWGSCAVDARRPPLVDTHINPAGVP